MIFKGIEASEGQIFSMAMEILSNPCALFALSLLMILMISSLVTLKEDNILLVMGFMGGSTLPFSIGRHIEAKYLLKISAFSWKLVTKNGPVVQSLMLNPAGGGMQ